MGEASRTLNLGQEGNIIGFRRAGGEFKNYRALYLTCFKTLPALLTEVKNNRCFPLVKSDNTRGACASTGLAASTPVSINPWIQPHMTGA